MIVVVVMMDGEVVGIENNNEKGPRVRGLVEKYWGP